MCSVTWTLERMFIAVVAITRVTPAGKHDVLSFAWWLDRTVQALRRQYWYEVTFKLVLSFTETKRHCNSALSPVYTTETWLNFQPSHDCQIPFSSSFNLLRNLKLLLYELVSLTESCSSEMELMVWIRTRPFRPGQATSAENISLNWSIVGRLSAARRNISGLKLQVFRFVVSLTHTHTHSHFLCKREREDGRKHAKRKRVLEEVVRERDVKRRKPFCFVLFLMTAAQRHFSPRRLSFGEKGLPENRLSSSP